MKTNTTKKLAKLAHTDFVGARRAVEDARSELAEIERQQASLREMQSAAAAARVEAASGAGASSAQLSLHADHERQLRRQAAELSQTAVDSREALAERERALQVALRESKRSDAVHEQAVAESLERHAVEEQREQDEYRPRGKRR